MDQLAQIVFITVLTATDNLLFCVARLAIANLRILLSLFELSEIPGLVHFTNPCSAFVLSLATADVATLAGVKVCPVDRHVHCVAFSRLIAFFMQRENHLLMRIVLRKPLLRVGQTCIGSHLAPVA